MSRKTKVRFEDSSAAVCIAPSSTQVILGLFLVLFAVCPIYGQVATKPPLTEKDYHLWGTMYLDKMSESGNWISYGNRYNERPSELILKRTDGEKMYRFDRAGEGGFCKEDYFACLTNSGVLHIIGLGDGSVREIDGVDSFAFTENGQYLITWRKKILSIRKPDGRLIKSIAGIEEYRISGNKLICTGSAHGVQRVLLIDLTSTVTITDIAESAEESFSNFVWNWDGKSLVFIKNGKDRSLYYYSLTNRNLVEFDPDEYEDTNRCIIPADYGSGLSISTDGERVFLSLQKEKSMTTKFDGIQIWKGNDAVVLPRRALTCDEEFNSVLIVWWPERKQVRKLTSDSRPFLMLNSTEDFVVSYNPEELGKQYVENPAVNYYVTNIETGEIDLLVRNQSTALRASGFSPEGNYFVYFNENQWRAYNFRTRKHMPLNTYPLGKLTIDIDRTVTDPYGIAGWGLGDDYILFYDALDIWKVPIDGTAPIRLTDGRESQTQYRIVPPANSRFRMSSFRGHVDFPYDIQDGVIVSAESESRTGYYLLKGNGTLQKIVFDEQHNNAIMSNPTMKDFVFLSENYNIPPELNFKKLGRKIKRIDVSNPQHYNYAWGMQETIQYFNSKGDQLKGLLYYPANFDRSKFYPMVVNIYEQQYYRKKRYFNPSYGNMTGFNVQNLVADGYFVFLPDIIYDIGAPGLSATDCVTAAVKKVLERPYIDAKKVGLNGHSFGGYETNFIITQTDLFACAISGASVADFPSWYLSVGWNDGNPELWRFESQQFRMGKSLFDDYEGYLRNSPVYHAAKVNTPVLLWTGEDDRQVHFEQSIAFYLALRRLNKKEILLIYPGEGHALIKPENKKDLTIRMSQWFDYYLKESAGADWIHAGVK